MLWSHENYFNADKQISISCIMSFSWIIVHQGHFYKYGLTDNRKYSVEYNVITHTWPNINDGLAKLPTLKTEHE